MAFVTSHSESADDQELIRLYKATGDIEHIGRLFEKYLTFIYGVCLKYFTEEPAKDAAMQIFEVLVDKLAGHEVQNFKSWLHVVTRNHCLMAIRAQNRHGGPSIALNDELFMENEGFDHHQDEDKFDLEDDLQAMEECMENLTEEQRQSVKLFYLQEKSYNEIADQTGYTYKNVKSYIQNGKRNLKICMENREHAGK